MRKYILLIILLSCLHIAARGQTIASLNNLDLSGLPQPTTAKALHYWFDDDNGNVKTAIGTSGTYMLDASQLIEGIHTLHYQVTGSDNVLAYVGSRLFLKMNGKSDVTTPKPLRYWFDDDNDNVKTIATDGVQTLDVSALFDGLHTIHYQVTGSDGIAYYVASALFLKISNGFSSETVSAKLMYWFDNDSTMQLIDIGEGVQLLDASGLTEGLHTLHYQVLCDNGQMTSVMSVIFLRMNVDEETAMAKSLRYWFDDETIVIETSVTNGIQTLDAARLIEGLHTVHYQIVDSNGTLGAPVSSVFLKMDTSASSVAKNLRYWFDDDAGSVFTTSVAEGTQTLNVSALQTGLHTLNYQLIDIQGRVTPTVTRLFMKNSEKVITEGYNRVTKYQYWLNINNQAMQTVELDAAANPYTLIALLPIQKEPIQSSQFHFEMTNDVPTIYAKNTLHIRFYDAKDYFSDGQKPFVDYSVKQEVTGAEWLESGVRAITEKPAENAIKWYKVEAERGDSLSFKLERAATVQVFAPSGKELFSASGMESTNWFGCHVEEDGTFYVALHDVTAQQGSTISIYYEHIDKYAVLRQDVSVVGNSGSSNITFYGNGFDELTDVYLVCQSDTIHAAEIGHESKAMTSVTFDFDSVTLGGYKAIFQFSDGNLELEDCITVEEATPIEIDVTATFGKNNLLSHHKTKYIFSVRNNSNVTAYDVPLMIRVYTHNQNSLRRVDIEGYDLKKDCKAILGELYTDSLDYAISQVRKKYGDRFFFVESDGTDVVGGWAVYMHQAFVCPTIPPLSTKDIVVSLELGQGVYCYMWHPEIWDDIAESRSNGRRLANNNMGCSISEIIKNKICVERILKNRLPLLIAETTGSVAWGGETTGSVAWGGETTGSVAWGEETAGGIGARRKSPACSDYNEPMNCPPDGGDSAGYDSHDPNDMTGYTSESGSKYIKGNVLTLDYSIEFENDTTFATASAHTIVVKDTLNSHYFDLNSYKPTSIRIGEKSADLDGSQNFVKTIDMRPKIYAIAQVEGTFDKEKGIVTWAFTSLDPMTGEPTEDFMAGILPVNYDGTSGVGKVFFDVNLKQQFAQGTEIPNRATIVFDQNDSIMTPTWTNIIDCIAPESHITDVQMLNDSTATVSIEATDELSGPWRYDVYVQYGANAPWWKMAENVPIDTTACVKVYEGINHGFYVVVTDSAGNVEAKEAVREFTFEVFGSQVDTNTQIELAQGWNWMSHNQQEPLSVEALKPASARMQGQTEELIEDTRFGWMGDLEELLPTQMYKVQMDEPLTVQLSGRLFNAGFRSVPLYEGWNWLGYPVAHTMTPAEALAKLEAEEGDMLMGQDGLSTYADGQWTGTLLEMVPGLGYMYRSASDKNLFYNATAQASSRAFHSAQSNCCEMPENWTVDKRKYPNVMGVIAVLIQNQTVDESGEWTIGAFSCGECRGLSNVVGSVLMINVYGIGGEPIAFYAMNSETGEVLPVAETELFQANVLGTMQQPYTMHIGEATGIRDITPALSKGDGDIYDLQGRRVDGTSMQKGIYVTTIGKRTKTQKVIRR